MHVAPAAAVEMVKPVEGTAKIFLLPEWVENVIIEANESGLIELSRSFKRIKYSHLERAPVCHYPAVMYNRYYYVENIIQS